MVQHYEFLGGREAQRYSCAGREGVMEKGPSPVTRTQTRSILGKPRLTQHRCPLLPLLLLHIPSYKKLPSHPREVSAHFASPQSTQQRWRRLGRVHISHLLQILLSGMSHAVKHPNIECRYFLHFWKQLGSVSQSHPIQNVRSTSMPFLWVSPEGWKCWTPVTEASC